MVKHVDTHTKDMVHLDNELSRDLVEMVTDVIAAEMSKVKVDVELLKPVDHGISLFACELQWHTFLADEGKHTTDHDWWYVNPLLA